jgi:hypothetical protein
MRRVRVVLFVALLAVVPLAADSVLLADISFQPDTTIMGLDGIFLDNFTDLPDLGCTITFPACRGLDIAGTLRYVHLDSLGNTPEGSVAVSSTGPGSTPIVELDPNVITFESAVLTGSTFPLGDGGRFISTGTFTSDTLTPDVGFGAISLEGNRAVE